MTSTSLGSSQQEMIYTPPYYDDGEIIEQQWNATFVVFAYATSFVASFAAVRLLEQNLWRSEDEKKYATTLLAKYPKVSAAVILGFGTVWSMHFIGQSAVTLDHTPMCYNWPVTIGSMLCAIVFMYLGILVASYDVFSGHDREKKLKQILVKNPIVTSKNDRKKARWIIYKIAYFHKLQFIFAGGTLAALGALVMHYSGMYALNGPFQKVWSIPYIAASAVMGIVICFVGLWIIFRPLHFKVEKTYLRPVSAAVIAFAVCGLHFFGMLSVTYVADSELANVCGATSIRDLYSPNSWTGHQILALAVSYIVPTIALYVEHAIFTELRSTYVKLKDIRLDGSMRLTTSYNGRSKSNTLTSSHHFVGNTTSSRCANNSINQDGFRQSFIHHNLSAVQSEPSIMDMPNASDGNLTDNGDTEDDIEQIVRDINYRKEGIETDTTPSTTNETSDIHEGEPSTTKKATDDSPNDCRIEAKGEVEVLNPEFVDDAMAQSLLPHEDFADEEKMVDLFFL